MASPYGWLVPEVRVGDVIDDVTTPLAKASDPSIVIDPSCDDDDVSVDDVAAAAAAAAAAFDFSGGGGRSLGRSVPGVAGVAGVAVDRGNLPRDGALPFLSLLAVPWPPRRRHSWICR